MPRVPGSRRELSHSVLGQRTGSMSDPCSFSSPSRCVTKHLNLRLRLDFRRRVIAGTVELTVEALEDGFSLLVLSVLVPVWVRLHS